jgi:hypothetical protein
VEDIVEDNNQDLGNPPVFIEKEETGLRVTILHVLLLQKDYLPTSYYYHDSILHFIPIAFP